MLWPMMLLIDGATPGRYLTADALTVSPAPGRAGAAGALQALPIDNSSYLYLAGLRQAPSGDVEPYATVSAVLTSAAGEEVWGGPLEPDEDEPGGYGAGLDVMGKLTSGAAYICRLRAETEDGLVLTLRLDLRAVERAA